MTTQELRQAFLNYFESKGHTIIASSSLIPAGDPTLLFVNAGMVQFKDCFLGMEKRPYTRATTCQKCLRISGKHNDLENVGRTARHHTFFEMLGNFSFGDYFKQDAIKFAWEFLTKDLGLSKNRLWVTVYKEDDEAAELWAKNTDVLPERILRFGKEDNFWAMGETGPCGPCSEIHYYLGSNVEGQSEEEFRKGDGTYIEIWNLVFMQFNRDVAGNYTPLPKPSVDTGMGLERIAAIKQGVLANYDTDQLRSLITLTEQLSGKKYDGRSYVEKDLESDEQYAIDVAMRVAADHVRAAAFLVADGINPASDGRGYVLRRLIRRACRHGRALGFKESFLWKLAEEVIRSMGDAYPELKKNADRIVKITRGEEEKFLATIDSGISILKKEVATVRDANSKVLPGEVAFVLHDTYGFPLDLTEDMARTYGLAVDRDGFAREMELQRERSRSARASETDLILQRLVKPVPTRFVGYEQAEYESKVLGVYGTDGEVAAAKEGDEVAVVIEETPFYAESGGQVGDTGRISSNRGTLDVVDTQRVGAETTVHICRVIEGEVEPGDAVRLAIEEARRRKLRANHSATHLVHLALRDVLGEHIKQAGSRVSESTLRFDFNHFEPLNDDELRQVELIANQVIQENHQIVTEILPIEEAKKSGAVALFGEKYGEVVRVVQIGPRSRELCGGTHAARSGDIGVIRVLNEGSISAGVRRIEASGGSSALSVLTAEKKVLTHLSEILKTGERDLAERVLRLVERNRELERNLERLSQTVNASRGGDLSEQAVVLGDGTKIVAGKIEQANPKQLRSMADDLKQRLGSGCIALATVSEGKVVLLTAVTDDLVKGSRYHAGELMQEMAKVLGVRGGGRADLAQAGGGDPEKLDLALKRFKELFA